MTLIKRLAYAGVALLLATLLFSIFISRGNAGFLLIAGLTLIFAVPVWLLDLLILLPIRRMDWWMGILLPLAGAFLGPVCLFIFSYLQAWNAHRLANLWAADDPMGLSGYLICAAMVGLVTNLIYVLLVFSWQARNVSRDKQSTSI
jgi:hypothetical protein